MRCKSINWKGYIGKLAICCLVTYFGSLFLLEVLIGYILPKDFIDTKIARPLPWIITNILTLILSDILIYYSDTADTITHWKEKYEELDQKYSDLKKIHKKFLFKSSDFNGFRREDFLSYINDVADNSKNHLDDTDIELLKDKCESIQIHVSNHVSNMSALIKKQKELRAQNSVTVSFKSKK